MSQPQQGLHMATSWGWTVNPETPTRNRETNKGVDCTPVHKQTVSRQPAHSHHPRTHAYESKRKTRNHRHIGSAASAMMRGAPNGLAGSRVSVDRKALLLISAQVRRFCRRWRRDAERYCWSCQS